MNQLRNIFIILVLTATLGQFFSDLYLPSMPAISKALNTTIGLTQLTVSFYMLGYSLSTFIYGPISDTIGRKIPLLAGIFLCFVGSCVCVFAGNIYILILGRLLQGLGGGAGIAITAAIIRDISSGKKMSQLNSYLTMANMVVIIAAPMLGGYLQEWVGWHAGFTFLLIYSMIVLLVVLFLLPETKEHRYRINFKLSTYKNNITTLLTTRQFIGYLLCLFSAYAGILAWLTIGPALMQNSLSLTPAQFGWMCFLCGSGYAFGAFINSRFVMVYGINKMFNFGKYIMFFAGFIMLGIALMGFFNVTVIILPLMLFTFGAAMIFANSYAGAMTPFAKLAGLAAALLACGQLFGGFISSALMSLLPATTQLPLAVVLLSCTTLIIISKKLLI